MQLSILIPSKDEPKIKEMVRITEEEFPEAQQIIVCNDSLGKGKGWAVREALKHATGDVICLIDGDLDIHPRMIKRLIPFLKEYDIVVGRKQVRGSLGRRILTKCSRLYIKLLFGVTNDTQTGIKLFKDYALLPWETDGFMFDLEILAKARMKGLQIIEVPVEVTDHGSTSKPMKLRNVIRAFKESLRLWKLVKD